MVKRLTDTVGRVVEIQKVPNGSYFGFPTGADVHTFAGTCWSKYGSKNVVIAVKKKGGGFEVIKVSIN